MASKNIDLLFTGSSPGMESFREWIVLIGCATLIVLFILATVRLYRTYNKFTFDSMVMIMEGVNQPTQICTTLHNSLLYDYHRGYYFYLATITGILKHYHM